MVSARLATVERDAAVALDLGVVAHPRSSRLAMRGVPRERRATRTRRLVHRRIAQQAGAAGDDQRQLAGV